MLHYSCFLFQLLFNIRLDRHCCQLLSREKYYRHFCQFPSTQNFPLFVVSDICRCSALTQKSTKNWFKYSNVLLILHQSILRKFGKFNVFFYLIDIGGKSQTHLKTVQRMIQKMYVKSTFLCPPRTYPD